MKRPSTRSLYSVVFATVLAVGIVKAVRKCSLRLTSSLRRAHGLFEYGDYRAKYYVGIKLELFSGYRNHYVLWRDTETNRKSEAESYRDYLLRHIPDFDKKMFIRKVSPIKDNEINFVGLVTTPFMPEKYQPILESFAALLAAGRLIRASYSTSA